MQVIIRRATSSDAAAAAALYLRARRAGSANGTIPPLAHDDDDVRGWIAHVVIPRLECWVAERVLGPVVGMLVLEADWIDQLYVDPDLTRGGIGAELIAVAKRERPNGLRLWTFVSNEGAQRFYLRHGFHEVQRTDGSRNEEGAPDIQYAWDPAWASSRSTPHDAWRPPQS
jgi:GNAT superfamily N-acetyltransferase